MKKLLILPIGVAVFAVSAVVGGVTLSPSQIQTSPASSMLGAKAFIQAEAARPGATLQSVLAALERQQIPAALVVQAVQEEPSAAQAGERIELALAGGLDAQQILADVRQVLLAQGGIGQQAQGGPNGQVQTIAGLTYPNLSPEDNYPRLGAGTRNGAGLISMVTAAAYGGAGGVVSPN
jgi:hypothetical protein